MKKLNTASPKLMAPLQGLWRWLMPAVTPNASSSGGDDHAFPAPTLDPARHTKQRPCLVTSARVTSRPLRVIRVPDHGEGSSNHVGRLLISGRMADVCAELDRLVANEKTLH
ncbi:MAG: hypothetical protein KA803_09685 [Rhodoferax sp.]|nr:hypothetical protein [Rhodoferax sp.]